VSERCEVEDARGVKCFLRAADGEPGKQDGIFVAVADGRINRETERVGRAAVAERGTTGSARRRAGRR
jgi:hypothetical protein